MCFVIINVRMTLNMINLFINEIGRQQNQYLIDKFLSSQYKFYKSDMVL